MRRRWALTCGAALLLSSCYRVHVQSGLPPGDVAPDQDFEWHNAFFFGFVHPYGIVDLSVHCPEGWAEIEEQTDLLTGALSIVTFGIYTPHRITVVCARPGAQVPAMFGYDPAPNRRATYPAVTAGDPPPPPLPRRPQPADPGGRRFP